MLSFNIFERNGTMNQAFRFAHSVAPNLNTVGGLGKALAFLALPTYCPSTKKKKKKKKKSTQQPYLESMSKGRATKA